MRRLPSSALPISLAALLATAYPLLAGGAAGPDDRGQAARADRRAPTASPDASPDPIDASIDRAFALLNDHQTASAERVLAGLRLPDLTNRQRARAERALGQAYYLTGRRTQAAESFARALQAALAAGDCGEAGWARRWAGAVQYGDGRPDAADALWSTAREDFVAAGDAYGEFEVMDDLALRVTGLGRRPYAERCFAIARAQNDPLLEARARARWAQGLIDGGRPGPALIELERATAVMRPFGTRADPHLGDALATLGWALRAHGANNRAVPIHREAIRLAQARGDNESQMWNYLGLGIALAELGRGAQAETAIAAGLRAARRAGASTNVSLLTGWMGWIALKRGRWLDAVTLLESARAMPGVETTTTPLVHLSQAYRALGRLPEAADRATKAVEVARRLGLVDSEVRGLIETAQVAVARGDLDTAEQTIGDVANRLEAYRANLAPVDFLKRGFGDRFGDAYGLMVDLFMRRGRPRDALAAAERVRSRAFADLLAARRARERDDTSVAEWLLGGASDAASGAPTSQDADSPIAVPSLDADSLATIASRLSSTLVIYWVHETGSYAWVVDRDGVVRTARLETTPQRLRRAVAHAIDAVPELEITKTPAGSTSAVSSGRDAFKVLYATLWAPIEPFVPKAVGSRITIIPHGPLLALPFAALIDRGGRYLIERHTLHYAASGAVLIEALDSAAQSGPDDAMALLVADPTPTPLENGIRLPRLRAARHEVQAIDGILGRSSGVLVGRRASEAAVRAALPTARIAHFATHALVRDSDPLASHLLLGAVSTPSTPEADGRLTASEIAGMRLSNALVVLGACRSARGPISSDGIAGLTRAFMAAGAPSVIATLWDVTDDPTARVMVRFYRGYASGVPKDRALRAAQLALIADLRAGRISGKVGDTSVIYPEHPWLWAAPILVGAP